MQGNADFIIIKRKTIVTYLVILIVLAIATPALADYLGPNRTVTEWSSACKIVLLECQYVPSKDDYRYKKVDDWSCSLEAKPWQSYPDQPSSQGCFSATEGDQYWERAEVLQQTTTTYPPATITGTLQNCTLQNGWCVTAPQLDLAASEPLSGYNILAIEGTLNGQTFGCSDSNCIVGLIEGNNDFGFWALSSWGDSSTMGILSAKVDSISPSVGLDISGSSGTNGWYTSPAVISALGSDSGSGLAEASLSVDSGVWQSSATLTEGIYKIDSRAIDNAGNISSSSTTISVDTTTPSLNISINGTSGLNGWYKSIMQVSATASDSTSGVGALEVSVDGGAYQVYTSSVSLSDGYHIVQFKATDNAGNYTESTVQSFYIDTQAPEISIAETWELGEEVRYTVQDFGSGLASLRLVIEDEDEQFAKVAWNEDVSGEIFRDYIDWDGKFKDDIAATPGTYFVWIKSIDLAGNEYVALGRIVVPEPFSLFQSFQTESVSPENPTPPAELFEGDSLPTTTTTPLITSPEQSVVFGGSMVQAGVSTTTSLLLGAGIPSSSTSSSSNVLWGATAAAVLGAATAYALEENRKRKAVEETQRAAIVARIEEMEAQKETTFQARKVAQWLEGQELLNQKLEIARSHGASDQEIDDLKKIGSTQGLGKAIDATKSLTSSLERTRADIDRMQLEEEQNLLEKLAEKDSIEEATMQEQLAGLAAYYEAMRQGEHLPNWWEQTKSFVKNNIIQPVNTYFYQPIVAPAVEKTRDAAEAISSWFNEQLYEPYIKPQIEWEIERVSSRIAWANEHIYQPYIKPHIDRAMDKLALTISLANEQIYQPYIKPQIDREIDNLVARISWINENFYQPYIKPHIDREIDSLVARLAWINENLYQPHIQPWMDRAVDALATGMSWINSTIYQPVFQPVVSDIEKYIFDPLADKTKDLWNEYGEWVHGALDAAGFIPGLGEIADGLNGLIYLGEGRYIEASVSALAMIPILGDLGKAGKWTLKLGKEVLEEVAEKVAKEGAEELVENVIKESAEEVSEKIIKETSENVAEKAVNEAVDEAVEKSAKETVEVVFANTAKEAVEEIVEKAPTQAVEKATKEAADNVTTRVVNNIVADASELITKKASISPAKEIVEATADQVDDASTQIIKSLTERYGDKALTIIIKYGESGIEILQKYGGDAIDFVKRAEKLGVNPVDILDNPPMPGQTLEGWLFKISDPNNPVNNPGKLRLTDAEVDDLLNQSLHNRNSNEFVLGYFDPEKLRGYLEAAKERIATFFSMEQSLYNRIGFEFGTGDFWQVNRAAILRGIDERKTFVLSTDLNTILSNPHKYTYAEVQTILHPGNKYIHVKKDGIDMLIPEETLLP